MAGNLLHRIREAAYEFERTSRPATALLLRDAAFALARRDAIIRAWMRVVQRAIEAQATDEAYREGECSSARVELADARREAAVRLLGVIRRLAPEFSPERVAEEIK